MKKLVKETGKTIAKGSSISSKVILAGAGVGLGSVAIATGVLSQQNTEPTSEVQTDSNIKDTSNDKNKETPTKETESTSKDNGTEESNSNSNNNSTASNVSTTETSNVEKVSSEKTGNETPNPSENNKNDFDSGQQVSKVDYTELDSMINKGKEFLEKENDYSVDSVKSLKKAIEEAETFKTKNTSLNMSKHIKNIQLAIDNLENITQVDKTSLTKLLEKVKDVKSEDWSTDSFSKFEKKLENATKVNEDSRATQKMVDTATKDLDVAFNNLSVDKVSLDKVIEIIKNLVNEDYTKTSFEDLKKEFDSIDLTTITTQKEVNSTVEKLSKHMNSLVNVSELKKTVKSTDSIKKEAYTPSSYTKYETALTEAKEILEKEDATKEEVSNATKTLTQTISSLVEKANKKDLESIIKKAEEELATENVYTPNSLDAIKKELDNAKIVFDDAEVSQETVNETVKKLTTTVKQAVFKANKTNLKELADEVKKLIDNKDNFTLTSMDNLAKVYATYDTIMLDENISQTDVDKYTKTLDSAKKSLVIRITSGQIEAFARLKEDMDKVNPSDYTTESYTNLTNTFNEATHMFTGNVENTSKDVAETMLSKVNTMFDNLVKRADVTTLESKLNELTSLKNLTPKSQLELNKVIKSAKEIKENVEKGLNISQKTVDKTVVALTSFVPTYKVSDDVKNQLKQAMEELEDAIIDPYSDSTWEKIQEEKAFAKGLYGDENLTDEMATKEIKKINDLIANKDFVPANLDSLKDAITKAESEISSDWSTDSYNKMVETINSTKEAIKNKRISQLSVDDLVVKVTNAHKGLKVDKTMLQATITDAESKNASDYTVKSYKALKEVINNANTMLNSKTTKQSEVNTMVETLKESIKNLVGKTDTTQLEKAIQIAESKNLDEFTPNSTKDFTNTLKVAKDTLTKVDPTIEEVSNATINLNMAIDNLVKRADLTNVKETLKTAKEKAKGKYSEESIEKLNKTISSVERAITDANISQTEVNAKVVELNSAIKNLVVMDKTELNKVIESVKEVDMNTLTPNSATTITEVLTRAETLMKTPNVSQNEIDAMTNELSQVLEKKQLKANKKELSDKIANAKKVNKDKYTDKSYEDLQSVITLAESIMSNDNISQADADTMVSNITNAINSLVEKVDKATLLSNINIAKEKLNENYTKTSKDSLNSVITKAIEVYNNTESTQEEVNDINAKLILETNNLVELADTSELSTVIANAEKELEKGFTEESKNQLKAVIDTVKNLLNSDDVTVDMVTKAITDVQNAVNNLRIDTTPLSDKIAEMESKDMTAFKPSSVKAFQDLIENAKTKLNTNITVDEMNTLIQELQNTYDNMEVRTNTSDLTDKIEELRNMDKTGYTAESVKTLNDLLNSVEEQSKDENITFIKVNQLLNQLNNATKTILKVDKTSLIQKIADAKKLYDGNYTKESLDTLRQAVALGETVVKTDSATLDNVNAAISGIDSATKSLEQNLTKEEAYNQLKALFDSYVPIMDKKDSYTAETFDPFFAKMREIIDGTRNGTISAETDANISLNHKKELETLYNNLEISTPDTELGKAQRALIDYCDSMDTYDFSKYAELDVAIYKRYINDTREMMKTEDFNDLDMVKLQLASLKQMLNDLRLDSEVDHTTIQTADMSPMLPLLNKDRVEAGLNEVQMDSELNKAAEIRATEMSRYFSTDYKTAEVQFHEYAHQRPVYDGTGMFGGVWDPFYKIENEINFNGRVRGENAALGSSQAEAIYKAWWNSPGHHDIMMDQNITHVGIACIKVGEHQWLAYMETGRASSTYKSQNSVSTLSDEETVTTPKENSTENVKDKQNEDTDTSKIEIENIQTEPIEKTENINSEIEETNVATEEVQQNLNTEIESQTTTEMNEVNSEEKVISQNWESLNTKISEIEEVCNTKKDLYTEESITQLTTVVNTIKTMIQSNEINQYTNEETIDEYITNLNTALSNVVWKE